jgi:hypothetical protein
MQPSGRALMVLHFPSNCNAMIPKTITRKHIIRAAELIDRSRVPDHRRAKKFEVTVHGCTYPPKYLISIACQMVTGRLLKPDEFGGGNEANGFLNRLGFAVHNIATRLKVPTTSAKSGHLRIARAWLDMRTSQREFNHRRKKVRKELRAVGLNLADIRKKQNGETFKQIVEERFQADKKNYYQRLASLSSHAVQAGADILVLPACAMMFEKQLNFHKALGDKVPRIVAAGKFHVRKRSQTDTALILRDWKAIDVPAHEVLWTRLDGEPFSIMATISSTMKRVREGKIKVYDNMKPDEDAPVLLLDMGHNRYSGRYLYHSLRTIWESQRQSRGAVVILSSWHYRAAQYESSWTWPLAGKVRYVTWTKGIPNENGDVLDMIRIDFSKTVPRRLAHPKLLR